jgi:hypothetical protein
VVREPEVARKLVPRDLVVAINVKIVELSLELNRATRFQTRDGIVSVEICHIEHCDVSLGGPPIVVNAIVCDGEGAHKGDRD